MRSVVIDISTNVVPASLIFDLFPGIRGVYQGVVPTILKQGSNQAIRFFVMETLKNWYREGDPKKPVPLYVVGAFGAFAGACSVFGNTPIDVIKTRLQVSQNIQVQLCVFGDFCIKTK